MLVGFGVWGCVVLGFRARGLDGEAWGLALMGRVESLVCWCRGLEVCRFVVFRDAGIVVFLVKGWWFLGRGVVWSGQGLGFAVKGLVEFLVLWCLGWWCFGRRCVWSERRGRGLKARSAFERLVVLELAIALELVWKVRYLSRCVWKKYVKTHTARLTKWT